VKERTEELTSVNARLEKEVAERRNAEELLLTGNRHLTAALAELRATQQRPHGARERPGAPVRELEEAFRKILQNCELVLRAPAVMANPAKVAEYLQQILTAAENGRRALRRTREMTEVSVESVETVCADALVDRVAVLMKPKLREQGKTEGPKVSLVKQVDKGVELEGDPVMLRDMLAELVMNSVSAIPRRGKVTIGARQQGSDVVLSVEDDGLGITEASRQRLLNPGAAGAAGTRKGTGYGFIHEVVARHRGRLEIESRKGIGATVRVIIPSGKVAATAGTRWRLLAVDDDPMVREIITAYLSQEGCTVELAANGKEGLAKFCAGDFDIVLTDRTMPEMGGDQLAREVKKRKPQVPVVLLTGAGEGMIAAGEKPAGVDLVMGKPFTMAGLLTALAKLRQP